MSERAKKQVAAVDGMDLLRNPATGDLRLRRQRPDLSVLWEVTIEAHNVTWLWNALEKHAEVPIATLGHATALLRRLLPLAEDRAIELRAQKHSADEIRNAEYAIEDAIRFLLPDSLKSRVPTAEKRHAGAKARGRTRRTL